MSLPSLNGQIKTPLRWYPSALQPYWASKCAEEDQKCEWAIISLPDELPPFQFVVPASEAIPAQWRIFRRPSNEEVANISSSLPLLRQIAMADGDYFIFPGGAVGVSLPGNTPLYSVITFDDGSEQWSELFVSSCDTVAIGGRVALEEDFENLVGWGVGSSDNEADDTYSGGSGAPPGSPAAGTTIINLVDNKVYTYVGGVWSPGSAPSNGDYRLVKSTGQWLCYNCVLPFPDGWQTMPSPPWQISGGGVCMGPNPDGLGLVIDGLDTDDGVWTVRLDVSLSAGSMQVILGASAEEYVIDAPGVHNLVFTGPGEDQVFAITPNVGFVGCINSVSIFRGAYGLQCHHILEWTGCGDVGRTTYDSGFVNRYILPQSVELLRPTANIDVQSQQNGQGQSVNTRVLKEVEWTIELENVPWYVADALTEMAATGTVRLIMKQGLGADVLRDVRFDHSWPEDGNCLSDLTLFFKVDDTTSATSCCDELDRGCLEPCADVAGFSDDVDPETGNFYAIVAEQAYAEMGESELGEHVRCDSGLITVSGDGVPWYFSLPDVAWLHIAEVTGVSCYLDDCEANGYVITADVMPGYRAKMQESIDQVTWVDTDLDLLAEEWESNDVPIRSTAGYFRLVVYSGDCVLGTTDPIALLVNCDMQMRECTYFQDFRVGGGEAQTLYQVTSFIVDGDEQLSGSVPFESPLHIIDIDGHPFVTNLIDALNACGVRCFSFWPTVDLRGVGDGEDYRYFRIRCPSTATFSITIASTEGLGQNVYRYTDTGAERWDGASWIPLTVIYGSGDELIGPVNCESLDYPS